MNGYVVESWPILKWTQSSGSFFRLWTGELRARVAFLDNERVRCWILAYLEMNPNPNLLNVDFWRKSGGANPAAQIRQRKSGGANPAAQIRQRKSGGVIRRRKSIFELFDRFDGAKFGAKSGAFDRVDGHHVDGRHVDGHAVLCSQNQRLWRLMIIKLTQIRRKWSSRWRSRRFLLSKPAMINLV